MKIIKGSACPPKRDNLRAEIARLELGDCVEVDSTEKAQAVCVAMRGLGYSPVRRVEKTFKIWLTASEEE